MTKKRFILLGIVVFALLIVFLTGCSGASDAEQKQEKNTDALLGEVLRQVGMPAVKNFREAKLAKMIYELRDQNDFTTYTYLVSDYGGQLVFVGESIGYPLPYGVQFTNPMKIEYQGATVPQAEPNGLYSPETAEASWVMMVGEGGKVRPVYFEPRVVVSPFKLVGPAVAK